MDPNCFQKRPSRTEKVLDRKISKRGPSLIGSNKGGSSAKRPSKDGSSARGPGIDGSSAKKPGKDGSSAKKPDKDSSSAKQPSRDDSSGKKPGKDGFIARKPDKSGANISDKSGYNRNDSDGIFSSDVRNGYRTGHQKNDEQAVSNNRGISDKRVLQKLSPSDPSRTESISPDRDGLATVKDEEEGEPQLVTGYASKFHFYPKDTRREVDKYSWFLGENRVKSYHTI